MQSEKPCTPVRESRFYLAFRVLYEFASQTHIDFLCRPQTHSNSVFSINVSICFAFSGVPCILQSVFVRNFLLQIGYRVCHPIFICIVVTYARLHNKNVKYMVMRFDVSCAGFFLSSFIYLSHVWSHQRIDSSQRTDPVIYLASQPLVRALFKLHALQLYFYV